MKSETESDFAKFASRLRKRLYASVLVAVRQAEQRGWGGWARVERPTMNPVGFIAATKASLCTEPRGLSCLPQAGAGRQECLPHCWVLRPSLCFGGADLPAVGRLSCLRGTASGLFSASSAFTAGGRCQPISPLGWGTGGGGKILLGS